MNNKVIATVRSYYDSSTGDTIVVLPHQPFNLKYITVTWVNGLMSIGYDVHGLRHCKDNLIPLKRFVVSNKPRDNMEEVELTVKYLMGNYTTLTEDHYNLVMMIITQAVALDVNPHGENYPTDITVEIKCTNDFEPDSYMISSVHKTFGRSLHDIVNK